MIGFEKNHRFFWESKLLDAVSITVKGFTDQYQRSSAKSGDYKPVFTPVLSLTEQIKGHSEILVNKATDSDSEESSDEEEEFIREHNLKVYANKIEQKKIPSLSDIEKMLKPVISEDPQLYWERDPLLPVKDT